MTNLHDEDHWTKAVLLQSWTTGSVLNRAWRISDCDVNVPSAQHSSLCSALKFSSSTAKMASTRSSTSLSVAVFPPLKAAKAVVWDARLSASSAMLSFEGMSKVLGSKSSSSSSSSSLDRDPGLWMKAEGGEEGILSTPEELYNEHMQSLDLVAVKGSERHERIRD